MAADIGPALGIALWLAGPALARPLEPVTQIARPDRNVTVAAPAEPATARPPPQLAPIGDAAMPAQITSDARTTPAQIGNGPPDAYLATPPSRPADGRGVATRQIGVCDPAAAPGDLRCNPRDPRPSAGRPANHQSTPKDPTPLAPAPAARAGDPLAGLAPEQAATATSVLGAFDIPPP